MGHCVIEKRVKIKKNILNKITFNLAHLIQVQSGHHFVGQFIAHYAAFTTAEINMTAEKPHTASDTLSFSLSGSERSLR